MHGLSEYKQNIINLLYQNDNFIKLINPSPSECPDLDIIDVLNGGEWIVNGKKWHEQGHVFDFDFVDDTVVQDKTFIFIETDIESISMNMFSEFTLFICIFSAKKLVRLNKTSVPTAKEVKGMGYAASSIHGNRIDALCECIDDILNGYSGLRSIGEVKPSVRNHVTIYRPNSKYYGKCLRYTINGFQPGGNDCGD